MKLYLQERAEQLETAAEFARTQDRAAAAVETKKARQAEQIKRYGEAYNLVLTPPAGGAGMMRHELWKYHFHAFMAWEINHDHLLDAVRPWSERQRVRNEDVEKHRAAVEALYPNLTASPQFSAPPAHTGHPTEAGVLLEIPACPTHRDQRRASEHG
ncbi:hypothetical protein [Deinococcus hopiensis]|uniref:Uncharacterized protein n=1 Tax=Deinococcus hopiensis KR-140 TaxID=695939 RepID=A0A1W1UL08_9DEIO|nr:hypothetical protein [Deinococcus hopiensis]SMB81776.1 hypothetical protein SAMN00790413_04718 [Deinococcus hopiensis KR-140]